MPKWLRKFVFLNYCTRKGNKVMTDMQSKLLEMLKYFHKFCVEHDLRYFALGGTLLGAVRHKGFIPWDDDIDIGLPRKDYEKLIALSSEIASPFLLEKPLINKDFVYQYCKLYDTTTTLVENTRYKPKRGIYLDIFPLDGIGNTIEESWRNFKIINKKNSYIMTKICAWSKHRKFYKNLAIVISPCLPFPRWRKVLQKLDDICKSRNFDEYEFVANLYGNWHEKEIAKKEWFGMPMLYDFEDIQIYGLQDADSYLTAIYGDYMQLPSIENQKSHHNYIYIDINKSYLDMNERRA